ncbi:hypothetical protein, partial [Nocardia farcinica]|uniref:hypothetical protein n=1 Tax=Nocardia farcinica TaxID=37329 RepID=UPI00245765D2
MSWPESEFPYELPLTLGHEGAGTIAALGLAQGRLHGQAQHRTGDQVDAVVVAETEGG